MNRVYILGEVLSVSKVHFDYYNKLKAYFKFSISDMCGNEFLCIVQEKNVKNITFEKTYSVFNQKMNKKETALVICSFENGEYLVQNIY